MLRWTKWIAPVAGLALVFGITQAQSRAAETVAPAADAKASITVTVVDADGKPVGGADVTLTVAPEKKKKAEAAQAAPAKEAADPTPAPVTKSKRKVIATGVTDAQGKVVLANVPDGKYRATARVKGTGSGHEAVIVADGKDVSVTVTLKPRKVKAA